MRVLFVCESPWDRRLGASRVFVEFAEELERLGHVVEHIDGGDFPRAKPGVRQELQNQFAGRSFAAVRARAAHVDVIDALQGCVPHSRRRLGFHGLLVSRSVGLTPLYSAYVNYERARWPETIGHPLARPFREVRRRVMVRDAVRSYQHADLVLCPNPDEAAWIGRRLPALAPTFLPNALPELHLARLGAASGDHSRAEGACVAAIGHWTPRKGSRDWRAIVERVWAEMPRARFLFLGTGVGGEVVARDLGVDPADRLVEVVPQYTAEELPGLLAAATVGALPSYIEGFGLGIVESHAAGLRVVAYDAMGARTTVGGLDPADLVGLGDAEGFADRLLIALRAPPASREVIGRRAVERAAAYGLREISARNAALYAEGLERRRASGSAAIVASAAPSAVT